MAVCTRGVIINETAQAAEDEDMSRLLHSVEEARSRCICEFGHPRPKAEVPNELICLNQAQKHSAITYLSLCASRNIVIYPSSVIKSGYLQAHRHSLRPPCMSCSKWNNERQAASTYQQHARCQVGKAWAALPLQAA